MDFEKTITYVLMQISTAYRTNLQKAVNEIGLHSGQIFVLIELWKDDGLSQIDLVKNLSLAAPTVNKMVKSLMNNGFVESRRCGADNRLMRVYLTEKGKECENLVVERWKILEERMLSELTATEKLIFSQLFDKLKSALGNNSASISNGNSPF